MSLDLGQCTPGEDLVHSVCDPSTETQVTLCLIGPLYIYLNCIKKEWGNHFWAGPKGGRCSYEVRASEHGTPVLCPPHRFPLCSFFQVWVREDCKLYCQSRCLLFSIGDSKVTLQKSKLEVVGYPRERRRYMPPWLFRSTGLFPRDLRLKVSSITM